MTPQTSMSEDDGRSAALEEVPDLPGNSFHQRRKAAAVFKHGVLSRYLTPFIRKVGTLRHDRTVALIDGYAGPGRYADGEPGSPALLAETAKELGGTRTVQCHFVERDATTFARLQKFLATEGAGLNATPYHGDVRQHFDTLVSNVGDLPLLAYLDPFGWGVPFDDLVKLMNRGKPGGAPATTEVLLNLTARGVARAGGIVLSPTSTPSTIKHLARADAALGGGWWQGIIESYGYGPDVVRSVANTFAEKVVAATRGTYTSIALPVLPRVGLDPVYYLVFFSRHEDGLWLFNDAASGAAAAWRSVLAPPPPPEPELALWNLPAEPSFEDEEDARAADWVKTIESNVSAYLDEQGTFRIGQHITEVYGLTLGQARRKHVRAALVELRKAGLSIEPKTGDVEKMVVSGR